MLMYNTGGEPDHKVAVNPNHVVYVAPKGNNFTWIYVSNGDKFLVDAKFERVVGELKTFFMEDKP